MTISEPRQELEQLRGIPFLVEEIRAEHELPRRLAEQRLRIVPANPFHAEPDAVPFRVGPQERDCVVRPVCREHARAAKSRRERRKPEPCTELEHAPAAKVERRYDLRERDAARPELRPVRQELVLVEGLFVDELVGVRRPQERDAPVGELECFLDQSVA